MWCHMVLGWNRCHFIKKLKVDESYFNPNEQCCDRKPPWDTWANIYCPKVTVVRTDSVLLPNILRAEKRLETTASSRVEWGGPEWSVKIFWWPRRLQLRPCRPVFRSRCPWIAKHVESWFWKLIITHHIHTTNILCFILDPGFWNSPSLNISNLIKLTKS